MIKKVKISTIINVVLALLVCFFIARFIHKEWGQIASIHISVNYLLLFITFILFEIYWFCQVLNWRNIMQQLGIKQNILLASHFYCINCLLAYIPGKVGNLIGMSSLANKHHFPKKKIITGVFLVQIYALMSGGLIICLTHSLLIEKLQTIFAPFIPLILIAIVAGFIFLSPPFIRSTQKIAGKLLKKEFSAIQFSYYHHLLNIIVYMVCWFILALPLALLLKSFEPSFSLQYYIDVLDIFLASYLVGLLAVTLPSGLGVVELGLSYGYNLICNPAVALIGAIGFRLMNLTALFLNFFIILKLKYYLKLKHKLTD